MKQPEPHRARRLSAVSGPLCGRCFPLTAGLAIGRANGSDVQIVDARVSRQHARVKPLPGGGHELVDLDSANGTLVEGRRVQRLVLEPGLVFSIAGSELLYEEAPDDWANMSAGGHARGVDGFVLRATRSLEDLKAEVGDAQPVDPRAKTEGDFATEPWMEAARQRAVAAAVPRQLDWVSPESLLEHIMEYRFLRWRRIRGTLVDDGARSRFEDLHTGLTMLGTSDRRTYARFSCIVDGRLRDMAGTEHRCRLLDVAVDGARVQGSGPGLGHDSLVWLSIDQIGQHVFRIPARVTWTLGDELGLAFSGTAESARGRYFRSVGGGLFRGGRARARHDPLRE